MTYLTQAEGWAVFVVFAVSMIGIVYFATRPHRNKEDHFVAGRSVGTLPGAFSIAVSWIWAPAVFICSQKSYQEGLAGIFWFTVPNILCFFTFAPLALRLRRLLPNGYSMPDFMWRRFSEDRRAHIAFVVVTLGYELGAIIINALAGGILMSAIAGIELRTAITFMTLVSLSYAIWRAMPASIVTDFVQMSVVLLVAFVFVPWVVQSAGGWDIVIGGLAGVQGSTSPFDPWIAYSFGIPATLGLISGPIADQMFYQRVMSANYRLVVRTFVVGGLVFGVVPILLSILGFVAANPLVNAGLDILDPQLVGVAVLHEFLPHWTILVFAFMALCALCSTLDSAYLAVGSIWSVDVYQKHVNRSANDDECIKSSRTAMLVFAVIGTAIAMFPGLKLLWVFLIYGALASAALAPTVLGLLWPRLTARGAFWSIALSFIVGLPLSVYANVTESPHLVVAAALASVIVGFATCLWDGLTSTRAPFDFTAFRAETSRGAGSDVATPR